MNLHAYLDLLVESDLGEAWCHNLVVSLRNKDCCIDCVHPVLADAVAVLKSSVSDKSTVNAIDAFHAMESACQNTKIVGDNKNRKYVKSDEAVTHVTTMKSLIDYHFDISKALSATFYSHRSTHHDDKLAILAAAEFQTAKFKAKTQFSHLALARLWLAPFYKVTYLSDRRNYASKARDARGLIHYSNADILVEYTLALDPNSRFAKPTVIDGTGKRFMAAEPSDDWGRAVDLYSFAQQRSDVGGASEGLFMPPSVDVVSAINYLGIVGQGEPDGGVPVRGQTITDNDTAFKKLMQATTKITDKAVLTKEIHLHLSP